MAGLISQTTVEQIRAANDIVDVIGAAIPLKRAGANFMALCPFHKEKTPSFNVSPHKQIFHCFGCHKGGDVFTFVREYENLTFVEAIKRLAERARIPIELDKSPGAGDAHFLKDTLLKIHDQIAQRWQTALLNDAGGQIARDYLARRGVSNEAVKLFRLGYAPDAWDDTVNWATSKGFELATVEKGGLIIRKDGEQARYYDRFRGRLIFPICDEQGRIIGFSGRILTDEKIAKYVNSPETPIFTKGKVFFGLDKSKRAILDAGCAIICEGQLDLIACFMGGVQNVVAPQGTAFTADHARILKRYADEVVLCFDSDVAGQAAAARVLDSLLASGLAIRVATVPAPDDPDSFIKAHGGEAFRALIGKAEGFFDWYLNRLCATNDVESDRGRVAVLTDMAQAVLKTRNVVLIDTYAQKTAARLAVAAEAVRTEFKKISRSQRPAPARADAASDETPVEVPRPNAQEFWLLKLALHQDASVDWLRAHIEIDWIQHPYVRRILEVWTAQRDDAQQAHPAAASLTELDDDVLRGLATEAMADERPIPNVPQQLQDVALRLRNLAIERELAALLQRVQQPDLTDADRLDLLQRQQRLRTARRLPLAPLEHAVTD